ncbi:MAG: molybdopterin-dependent oxidoreductase [Dehalococcoidia bacterium]|nr:molybdopterin-dependent oxidoreductase [Dehalococcoidia bacterium]
MIEIKKSVCVWCKAECGVLVEVEDGYLKSVYPDPDWARAVYPKTIACPRLKAAKEYFYHPSRLNYPLKRDGERGSGKWVCISWEQALDEIASRTKALTEHYGSETIAWARGTGYRTDPYALARFFRTLGTTNMCTQGQICYLPRAKMADVLSGYFPHYSVRNETRCVVVIGTEPLVSRPITAAQIRNARAHGAKLIVIDPRRTPIAEEADLWLQLRPGTDAALLLGMLYVIISQELFNKEFVDKWCYGFNELKERVTEYPLERVAEITGVATELIASAAKLYATTSPACFVEGLGIEHNPNVAPALQARWALAALTSNIDIRGGDEQVGPHPQILTDSELEPKISFTPQQIEKQIGTSRFKLLSRRTLELINPHAVRVWGKPFAPHAAAHAPSVYRAMLSGEPYPVRALFCFAANPLITQANPKLVAKAIQSLDLVVVADIFPTPTTALADYVLPAASWLECPILWDFSGHSQYMAAGEAALPTFIQGEYEHKTDYDIYRELAMRLGKGQYWPWPNLEAYYDAQIKPLGLTHHEYVYQRRCELKSDSYRKYEEKGFATPTGKVELYSTVLEKLGYDPLPFYTEPPETIVSAPGLAQEYPFTLINGGRIREFFHSEWRQIDSVRQLHPNPKVQIHPITASKLRIGEGDWVWIETLRGRIKEQAEISDRVQPQVIHAEHGWWYPELPESQPPQQRVWESNVNVLLDDNPDVCNPVTGGWPLRTALCKLYKATSNDIGID